jgi:hypothetical protein
MIYPSEFKNWPVDGFKAPKIDDRKQPCIYQYRAAYDKPAIVDFWQLSIPSTGQFLNSFGYVQ